LGAYGGFEMKIKLIIRNNNWWALLDSTKGINTWAPIGTVSSLKNMKDVFNCAKLSLFYLHAGILSEVTEPIIRENGKEIIEIIEGKFK
jgi:hypothetical protein